MKNLAVLLLLVCAITFGFNANLMAQDDMTDESTEMVDEAATEEVVEEAPVVEEPAPAPVEEVETLEAPADDRSFRQVVKDKFIEGGWEFMSTVLACLIIGLAIAIERIITLNLSTTNTAKLIAKVEQALEEGGVEQATEVCKATRGPVASIYTQGLMRVSEGIEMVEKSIISYGSVEMGKLEKGLIWVSLCISLAPMLGFMGTVIGMIGAFDAIEAAGDISPAVVAGGIKVALLTTVGGLIVAIILQLFYNYCASKVDSLVNQMEDASISLVDVLIKHKIEGKIDIK